MKMAPRQGQCNVTLDRPEGGWTWRCVLDDGHPPFEPGDDHTVVGDYAIHVGHLFQEPADEPAPAPELGAPSLAARIDMLVPDHTHHDTGTHTWTWTTTGGVWTIKIATVEGKLFRQRRWQVTLTGPDIMLTTPADEPGMRLLAAVLGLCGADAGGQS